MITQTNAARETVLVILLAATMAGCGDHQPDSPPDSNPASAAAAADDATDVEYEQLLKYLHLEWGLEPLPQEQGAGYYVSTYFTPCREEDLPLLLKVKGLRAFYNYNHNIYSPEGWRTIARIPDLETLVFEANTIEDEHVGGLKQATRLKDVQLFEVAEKNQRLTGSSFESLQNLKQLQRLVLRTRALTDQGCQWIGKFHSLRELQISGPLTDAGLESFGQLRELRRLALKGEFTDEGLAFLADLTNLQELVLKSDHLDGSGLKHLAGLPELRSLGFSGSADGPVSLAALADCRGLIALDLGSTVTDDELLATLGELPQIESLSLKYSRVTDDGLAAIWQLRNLQQLNLQHTDISNEGLKHLQPLSQLRLLAIGRAANRDAISGSGLSALSQLPRLEALDMRLVSTEDIDLTPLVPIRSLKRFNTALSFEDQRVFQEQRPDVQHVESIIFTYGHMAQFDARSQDIP